MGFNNSNYEKFRKFLADYVDKTNTKIVTELGCQQSWLGSKTDAAKEFPPKHFFALHFKTKFKKIHSIDLRKDHKEVIKFDLRDLMPWDDVRKYKADVVMNYGTTEHVNSIRGQYNAWLNMHRLCKVGGYMLHDVPERGSWKGHPCSFYYDEQFFTDLAIAADYDMVDFAQLYIRRQGNTVWCALRKTKENFITYNQFIDVLK